MAASCRFCSLLSKLQNISLRNATFSTSQPWRMSQYNPYYLEPTLEKEELKKPLEESDLRRFRSIKAAKTNQVFTSDYDPLVQKFINRIMKMGNKKLARDIMDRTFENIKHIQVEKYNKAASEEEKSKIECNPSKIFHQAVENCKPILITTKIVKGGISYQVPVPCPPGQGWLRATRWLVESCRDKERKFPMHQKLTWELMDAYKMEGKSIRKKQELHRVCEANRAFAHFRWS